MVDDEDVYVTPGHPVVAGAGFTCSCSQCRLSRDWLACGFTLGQVDAWIDVSFATPEAAMQWAGIGVEDPIVAERWRAAGFTPKTARGWLEIDDITPAEAAACANGYLTPSDVERIRRADRARVVTQSETSRVICTREHGIDL